MVGKATVRRVPDTYLKLVKRFPLIHIQDDAHLDEAIELVGDLLRQERDQGTQEFLDVLTDLVAAYEAEHFPMPDVSETDVLRELMRCNRLSQMQLAKEVGMAQSTVSAVLTGARAHQGPDPQTRQVLRHRAGSLSSARSRSRVQATGAAAMIVSFISTVARPGHVLCSRPDCGRR